MPEPVVLVDTVDRVATITLNRPEARNALSRALTAELAAAVAGADADEGVDVVILTGADPAFSAGVDLKEAGTRSSSGRGAVPETGRGPLPPTDKPIIGAINGAAVTGGIEVALACDWLIASERATFADTHARVGVMPGWGLTVLLPEAVGVRRARQMSATGNFVDARTALAWGLVNEVVPHEELLPRCRALAADIVSNDQAGVRRMMRTYDELEDGDGRAAWERELAVSRDWMASRGAWADAAARREAIITRGRSQAGTPR
jgi:enoyl-CoA hydratase